MKWYHRREWKKWTKTNEVSLYYDIWKRKTKRKRGEEKRKEEEEGGMQRRKMREMISDCVFVGRKTLRCWYLPNLPLRLHLHLLHHLKNLNLTVLALLQKEIPRHSHWVECLEKTILRETGIQCSHSVYLSQHPSSHSQEDCRRISSQASHSQRSEVFSSSSLHSEDLLPSTVHLLLLVWDYH